tara:strand:+ start:122 stop:859 length:738 start_codon:yes stop_codon:yes gene_type:complete
MIIVDIPVYDSEGGVSRLSSINKSNISNFKKTPIKNYNSSLILITTESFGSVIVSSDSLIMGNKPVSGLKLTDYLQVNPVLKYGNESTKPRWWDLMDKIAKAKHDNQQSPWGKTEELSKWTSQLLALNEKESNIALKCLTRTYAGYKKNTIYIKGKGHAEITKTIQIMYWKKGIHSRFNYSRGSSMITLKDDCKVSLIDFNFNKVFSQIIELKIINKINKQVSLYKVTTKDLPILPTVAGMFCLA